ncbi:hypothetical protein SAMN05421854_103471 [Amycolatopsis rubida]|uniref:Uncharacterized protein n=1 Tax=Amycolatopsis rubida TaxID=112413 RepID=A0A1I5L775_9PSEU|nr:hypothetical protein SAMN05421854_103471 [Amycolatopsis rubida]
MPPEVISQYAPKLPPAEHRVLRGRSLARGSARPGLKRSTLQPAASAGRGRTRRRDRAVPVKQQGASGEAAGPRPRCAWAGRRASRTQAPGQQDPARGSKTQTALRHLDGHRNSLACGACQNDVRRHRTSKTPREAAGSRRSSAPGRAPEQQDAVRSHRTSKTPRARQQDPGRTAAPGRAPEQSRMRERARTPYAGTGPARPRAKATGPRPLVGTWAGLRTVASPPRPEGQACPPGTPQPADPPLTLQQTSGIGSNLAQTPEPRLTQPSEDR